MNNAIEFIDAYFTNQLSEDERKTFEKRCETDSDFAGEVSLYIASRAQLKSMLDERKREEFRSLYNELLSKESKGPVLRTLAPYLIAVAASLLVFIVITLNLVGSTEKIAQQYIDENFTTLGVTMGSKDSLQVGLDAFNAKDYTKAESIFKSLTHDGDLSAESTKYLGITYLMTEQYDDAIKLFDNLAAYPDLYANPGKFYEAIARMKRSTGDDVVVARQLLEEVIEKKLPGAKEASEWIDNL